MKNLLNEQIGHRIREKRESLGLSREKLSEIIGISPQFLAEIETGKKGMSSSTLFRICNGLSVSADYIIMGRCRSNDLTTIGEMLSNLDEKYLPFAEDLLKTFILAIGNSYHGD
jgi:transcriptional regulator with XRE-family HTH domain